MPFDCVEITETEYRRMFDGQTAGKLIVPGVDGYPTLVDRPPPTAAELREQRNFLLSKTDWTQAADVPQATKDKWAPYRQALRDIPQQAEFPMNVVWPTKPE